MKKNKDLLVFLLMLILVPLAGEPKIHPFSGDLSTFRVSFGSPIFLLFLLWIRNTSFILSGFCVGLSVTIFRICLDIVTNDASFSSSFLLRAPAFFYYFTYAACFHLPAVDELYSKAIRIAGWSILAEFFASIAELAVTNYLLGSELVITFTILFQLILIAVIRCFFILSFFFLTQLYQSETRIKEEKEQKKHMLLLIANLYEEVIQLNKSQKNAEQVTRNCYQIYENLQDPTEKVSRENLSAELLSIAGQVHEIKKDNQRIYAGLRQLTNNRRLSDYLPAGELGDIIVQSNLKYANSLKKDIRFMPTIDPHLPPLHVYTLLSLVNNLVANAVEAIKKEGFIKINFTKIKDSIEIRIMDNAGGISPNKINLIFKPGYTTKFDEKGNPSTGVGLPYVKHLTETLGGKIAVNLAHTGATAFILTIPLKSLKG